VYLGAGDRHLALLAVEHMINGPIAVANTNIHVSPNSIASGSWRRQRCREQRASMAAERPICFSPDMKSS
jgi:hypothetical protein